MDLRPSNRTQVAQTCVAQISELVDLIEFRPGVLQEALIQRDAVLDYFRGVLNFSAASHPYTYDLAYAALKVGQFIAMHYKRRLNIPRPSYISPSLMPPIDPPGHASFPSGHATEAYLIARCLAHVLSGVLPSVDHTAASFDLDRSPLMRMAERIARNREVLGVHYPLDSEAGRVLAEHAETLLLQCRSVDESNSDGLIAQARLEW